MDSVDTDLQRDVQAIGRIDAVPTLLRVLCQTTGMGFAAIARVTEDGWTACAVLDDIEFGMRPGDRLNVSTTLCKDVRASRTAITIDHASVDPIYFEHPTPKLYAIESYISVPIILKDGSYFGNLCAIDPQPARVSEPRVLDTFKLFAQLVGLELENERTRGIVQAALLDEKALGELREQFVAVLGHDLRNPLGAVSACSQLIGLQANEPAAVRRLAARIDSSVNRMAGLIDDVLDFARVRLGGGLQHDVALHDDLSEALEQVVTELRDTHPGRIIEARVDLTKALRCDRGRLQQLTSNLLANALTHGAKDGPVEITVLTQGIDLVIEVWNSGEPIPEDSITGIFRPFQRRSASRTGHGLGLGLHICDQIVRAYGGTLRVTSTQEFGTEFAARLPVVEIGGSTASASNRSTSSQAQGSAAM